MNNLVRSGGAASHQPNGKVKRRLGYNAAPFQEILATLPLCMMFLFGGCYSERARRRPLNL